MNDGEDFDAGIRNIVENAGGSPSAPRSTELRNLANKILTKLDAFGRAKYKLAIIRKDPEAVPETIQSAAQAYRGFEREVLALCGEYVDQVVKEESGE